MAPDLRIAVWPGMPDQSALSEAARRVGCGLDISVIASNEDLDELIHSGEPFDLITPSDYLVDRLRAGGELLELDRDLLPRFGSIADWTLDPAYDPGNRYSIPFAFGTTGYLHDRRIVGGPPTWDALLTPLPGVKTGLLDEVREVVGAALISLGHSPNSTDEVVLGSAVSVLRRASEAVVNISSDDFTSPVVNGEVAIHHAWSGPAARVAWEHEDLSFTLPEEGAIVWVTTAAVPAKANHPDLAHRLIAELMEPELASLATINGGYSTPNMDAFANLPEELSSNEVLFPDDQVLARCFEVEEIGPEGEARLNETWSAAGLPTT